MKAIPLADFSRQRGDDLQIQLRFRPATLAHEVLMSGLFCPMPFRHAFVEVDVLDQSLLLEELHGAVDGGQVHLGKPRMDSTVDVLDRDVAHD